MELKIFKCMHCGNIIEMIDDHGVPVICCGEPMKAFKAGESDGAAEKHVPADPAGTENITVSKNRRYHYGFCNEDAVES